MRTIKTFTDDSIERIATAVRQLAMRIGNLERRLAARSWPLIEPLRPKCHFTFDEPLTTADETAAATIEVQYGQGIDHASDEIVVTNLPTSVTDVFEFYADAGDWGIASYSGESNIWYIDLPECP